MLSGRSVKIHRKAVVRATHAEFFVKSMGLWPSAVRGQGQPVASAASRDFERCVHQLLADSGASSARIDHHVFDNRGRLQRAGQVPEDENVIGAHNTPVLDRNQKDLVGLSNNARNARRIAAAPGLM